VARRAVCQVLHFVFLHKRRREPVGRWAAVKRQIKHFPSGGRGTSPARYDIRDTSAYKGSGRAKVMFISATGPWQVVQPTPSLRECLIEVTKSGTGVHARQELVWSYHSSRARFEHGEFVQICDDGHAGSPRQACRRGRHFHGRMAIPASRPSSPHVVFVAEWYNLGARVFTSVT